MSALLSRDDFKGAVFSRDGGKCVVCKDVAVDAHHLIERKLWDDGGYYLNNGVSLCSKDHLKAESTEISAKSLRELAGIKITLVPQSFNDEHEYDKWGNIILPNGTLIRGPISNNENVIKALKLNRERHDYATHIKYPRTYHLPWSLAKTDDDKTLSDTNHLDGKKVIITTKMDGENTTVYNDLIHARSVDSKNHPSRNYIKRELAAIQNDIPAGMRICGENLFARHSIFYNNLRSYFYAFSVWDENNFCLGWDESLEWLELLELNTPDVLFRGVWDEEVAKGISKSMNLDSNEGYVVRLDEKFHYMNFPRAVAKFVRKGHVQTNKHWMIQDIVPNELKK